MEPSALRRTFANDDTAASAARAAVDADRADTVTWSTLLLAVAVTIIRWSASCASVPSASPTAVRTWELRSSWASVSTVTTGGSGPYVAGTTYLGTGDGTTEVVALYVGGCTRAQARPTRTPQVMD